VSEEAETPDEKAFERFRRLAKKVVSVPSEYCRDWHRRNFAVSGDR